MQAHIRIVNVSHQQEGVLATAPPAAVWRCVCVSAAAAACGVYPTAAAVHAQNPTRRSDRLRYASMPEDMNGTSGRLVVLALPSVIRLLLVWCADD